MSTDIGDRDEFLSNRTVGLLAVIAAISVANGYYVQPLLVEIGHSLAIPKGLLGLLPGLSQFGLAIGLVALLPLADAVSARALLSIVVSLQIGALLLMATGSNAVILMMSSFAVGLFGLAPYVLPPYASLRVPVGRLGHTTGIITRGVICGILLARTIAGVIAVHFGWRYVYAFAALGMTGVLFAINRMVKPQPAASRISYWKLLASLLRLVRSEPTLRVAALCQAFSFGSFTVFWIGSTFYLGERYGWRPDSIGYVGVLGAIAAFMAPMFGRVADRIGPSRTRFWALVAMATSWIVFAVLRDSLVCMALALVLLDIGATVADISNRTILYTGAPAIRTRLNAVYQIAMFLCGSMMSVLVTLCWSWGGWSAVCWLGGLAATISAVIAWRHSSGDR